MTALAADRFNQSKIPRNTLSRAFDSIAANVALFVGAMVSMDTSGNIRPARATASDKVVGVNQRQIPAQANAGAPVGGGKILVDRDYIHRLGNSAGADAITSQHIGRDCYVVDDQTVALTSAGGARPRAGRIHMVDSQGVYVDFTAEPNLKVVVGPLRITDVSAASDSAKGYAPISGVITEVWGVLGGAITVADSVITPKVGSTPVTGTMTVPFTGSGADVRSFMHPTGANRVTKGQPLLGTTGGESTTTATMDLYFEIEAD